MQNKILDKTHKNKTFRNCEIPTIGLGTYELKGEACIEAVTHALEIGYRHIDTAQQYGNEEEIGKAIAASKVNRDDIFITTKIWHTDLKPEDLNKKFNQSLKKLQTTYIDLLLIHWPSNEEIPLSETLSAMQDLKSDGKVRFLGVSNFNQALVNQAIEEVDIVANQVEYHPFLNQDILLKLCADKALFLIAYTPLAMGEVEENPVLKEFSEKYSKTPAQIALRWLIQQRNVIVIPRSSSSVHRIENLEVFDFDLSEEEMNKIDNLNKEKRYIDPIQAPEWD